MMSFDGGIDYVEGMNIFRMNLGREDMFDLLRIRESRKLGSKQLHTAIQGNSYCVKMGRTKYIHAFRTGLGQHSLVFVRLEKDLWLLAADMGYAGVTPVRVVTCKDLDVWFDKADEGRHDLTTDFNQIKDVFYGFKTWLMDTQLNKALTKEMTNDDEQPEASPLFEEPEPPLHSGGGD